jgi:hypothetical protein
METMDLSDIAVVGGVAVATAFAVCAHICEAVEGWSNGTKRAREDDDEEEREDPSTPSKRRKNEVCNPQR